MEKDTGIQGLNTAMPSLLSTSMDVVNGDTLSQSMQLASWWPEDQPPTVATNVQFLNLPSYDISGFSSHNTMYSTWDERYAMYAPEPVPVTPRPYISPCISPSAGYPTRSVSPHAYTNGGALSPPTTSYHSPPPYSYNTYPSMGHSHNNMYSTNTSLDAESPLSSPESLEFFNEATNIVMPRVVSACLPPPLTSNKFTTSASYPMFPSSQSVQMDRKKLIRMPQRKGGIQLWQFLYALLSDAKYSNIMEWTSNRGSNEFRMLEPESIAVWWGTIKSKPTMTYDKFSRSLRYYYHKGILKKIQGERYMYQFLVDPEDMYRHIGSSDKRPDLKTMPKEAKMAMGIFQKQSAEKTIERAPIVTKPPEGLNKVKQEFPSSSKSSKFEKLETLGGLDFNNSNNTCSPNNTSKDLLFPFSQPMPILIPATAW